MNSSHPPHRPTVHDAIRIVGIERRLEGFCISEDGRRWTDGGGAWHTVTDLLAQELGVGGAEARWLLAELALDVSAGSFDGGPGSYRPGITLHEASAKAPDSKTAARQFATGYERLETNFRNFNGHINACNKAKNESVYD